MTLRSARRKNSLNRLKELALGPLSYGEWAAAAPGMIVGVVPEGIPQSELLITPITIPVIVISKRHSPKITSPRAIVLISLNITYNDLVDLLPILNDRNIGIVKI
jgi:hypothetical protein